MKTQDSHTLSFKPLSIETWKDFEEVFGERGACGGCWCMAWRLKNRDFERLKGDGNKHMMYELVKMKEQTGIIAYQDNEPVG